MTISALTILVVGIVVVLVFAAAGWAFKTANRLDRLHVRVDLASQALDAALARRAVVARSIGAGLGSEGRELIAAADNAEHADPVDRENAENTVSAALAQVDPATLRSQLVSELADAETRVMIARRFYNDAVRDTLALRNRRLVRWLQLGGTAPRPQYFEIVERPAP
ncbi:hypothetical protein GCM10027169_20930 [Gordonia jinhuaensis]|uniref:NUDIX hydrolase n=1 Tax=Gordonia jinhuaensis TaxID=1517702 RepID=A0A916TFW0_9ACTN|nr:hypothetical protein GCM10011489_33820 [Gordonia jinhuaensis]